MVGLGKYMSIMQIIMIARITRIDAVAILNLATT